MHKVERQWGLKGWGWENESPYCGLTWDFRFLFCHGQPQTWFGVRIKCLHAFILCMVWEAIIVPQLCFHTCAGSDVHTCSVISGAFLAFFHNFVTKTISKTQTNLSLVGVKKVFNADKATPKLPTHTMKIVTDHVHMSWTLYPLCWA